MSQERGRAHHSFNTNVAIPRKARTVSRSRSRERSRSRSRSRDRFRDLSPFSYDSRLHSNFDDPFHTIAEDDENGIEMGVILPHFSNTSNSGKFEPLNEETRKHSNDTQSDTDSDTDLDLELGINIDQKLNAKKRRWWTLAPSSSSKMTFPAKVDKGDKVVLPDFTLPTSSPAARIAPKIKALSPRRSHGQINVHVSGVKEREKFVEKLCESLMLNGCPSHRVEEWIRETARVLELKVTFIALPGSFVINFTNSERVAIVRVSSTIDLGKLDDIHDIYESVVHDRMGVQEAGDLLNEIGNRPPMKAWLVIILYCLSSVFVLPFFSGGWADFGPIAVIGTILGVLNFLRGSRPALNGIADLAIAAIAGAVGRALGGINDNGLFCFTAVVLGGLCMALPGYAVLRSSLELQGGAVISGASGLLSAVIYSLILGFGLLFGIVFVGWIDKDATTVVSCESLSHSVKMGAAWQCLFIPLFTVCQGLVCGAHWRQIPVIVIVGSAGYAVSYFVGQQTTVTGIGAAAGAAVMGVMSGIYDIWLRNIPLLGRCSTRLACMIPAIFNLVPGSLAARSGIAAGVAASSKANGSNATDLIGFAGTMVEIAVAIISGLAVASMIMAIISPRKLQNSIGL